MFCHHCGCEILNYLDIYDQELHDDHRFDYDVVCLSCVEEFNEIEKQIMEDESYYDDLFQKMIDNLKGEIK